MQYSGWTHCRQTFCKPGERKWWTYLGEIQELWPDLHTYKDIAAGNCVNLFDSSVKWLRAANSFLFVGGLKQIFVLFFTFMRIFGISTLHHWIPLAFVNKTGLIFLWKWKQRPRSFYLVHCGGGAGALNENVRIRKGEDSRVHVNHQRTRYCPHGHPPSQS